ncbi:MAG TPA: SRPBCC family protein [Candidatus Acidoferrales bacterium]|nr:SRPBCC family protein [Candidatus Acidoferrales bacterium]
MPEGKEGSSAATKRSTVVERKGDREFVVRRTFNAPAHVVFEAWSKADLFKRWWVPKSVGMTLLSCDMDVRTGGAYRLVFRHPNFDQPMAFFGTYREVTPNKRIVWSNEESDQGAVTTVTFEENAGKTLVTFHELYPTKAALDEALASSAEALPEQFAQLDELLAGRS